MIFSLLVYIDEGKRGGTSMCARGFRGEGLAKEGKGQTRQGLWGHSGLRAHMGREGVREHRRLWLSKEERGKCLQCDHHSVR